MLTKKVEEKAPILTKKIVPKKPEIDLISEKNEEKKETKKEEKKKVEKGKRKSGEEDDFLDGLGVRIFCLLNKERISKKFSNEKDSPIKAKGKGKEANERKPSPPKRAKRAAPKVDKMFEKFIRIIV